MHLSLDGDVSGRGPIAVLNRLPGSVEQFGVFVDEEWLGLSKSSLPWLEDLVQRIGFEPAVTGLAWVSIWVDDLPFGHAAQAELAHSIFSVDWVVHGIAKFLNSHERGVVVAEQHLAALMRLLVLYARDASVADLDQRESPLIERALLGMSALSDATGLSDTDSPSEWVPFFVQNGAFNSKEPLWEALARIEALLVIAASPEARSRKDFCDLDAWAVDSTGLSLRQQVAGGVAAFSGTGALSEGRPEPGAAYLAPNFFAQIADRLKLPSGGATAIENLLSADRRWYAESFASIESAIGLTGAEAATGYNRAPFDARPFLRLVDGRFMLWSPRAIVNWLVDGFYLRAVGTARGIGRRDDFFTFWGYVIEEYAKQLIREVYPAPRPVGAGRVFGEKSYGRRKQRKLSPDVAIEFGPDVVFVEVFSGRLSLETLVSGRAQKVIDDVTRMVAAKGNQLSRRIDDFLDGGFSYPGVERAHVRRVWPVVVTGPGLLMTEFLADDLDQRMADAFKQSKVQPLTILDLADLEQLVGLVEAGWTIPNLLSRKVGAYRQLDWRRMVADDPALPETRGSHVVRRGVDMWRTMIEDFGWDPSPLESRQEAA